jgi:acylphosphatase
MVQGERRPEPARGALISLAHHHPGVGFRWDDLDLALKARVDQIFNSNRYFTQKRAVEYSLTGWCRNTPNNKVSHCLWTVIVMTLLQPLMRIPKQVEGEAQGEEDAIKSFLKDIDRGPKHAHVVRLDHEDRELVEDENAFEVRR